MAQTTSSSQTVPYTTDAGLRDVAGAGHMVAGDQNDTFSKGRLDFFARL